MALPASYELLGTNPAWHHVLAAVLGLASAVAFYFVLRGLRFEARDALPIALLALLFPWASAIRLWPAGSLNNLAVLLLFCGFLIALAGLRIGGGRGLLIHLAAVACYAASILTYEATTAVAAMIWPAYIWLFGRRPGSPRALIDVVAVGAAAIYSVDHTIKPVADFSDQLGHLPDMLGDGAKLVAASLLPTSIPAELSTGLTSVVLAAAAAFLIAAASRGPAAAEGAGPHPGPSWAAVATVAVAALALCWAVFVPQAFYTPTFRGLEDRVNILALYPAAVLVWAVLRATGSLLPQGGYLVAVAALTAILVGYGAQDLRQQRDWKRSAELQESVLAAIERAQPPDGSLVLAFDFPAQVAPRVPVLNASWDMYPAAQLRTGRSIQTYPVFAGARLRCTPKGLAIDQLTTPLYKRIGLRPWGTPQLHGYSRVVFVDVGSDRSALIGSPEQCARALEEFTPGPWLDRSGS
jgi:hypothetical protein